MTETEAETFQHWRGMTGATAFHLIERHADGWTDISAMMKAWLKANIEAAVIEEREACAMVCDAEAEAWRGPKYSYATAVGEHCANKIRMRPNVEVTGAARLHRAASSDRRERGRPQG